MNLNKHHCLVLAGSILSYHWNTINPRILIAMLDGLIWQCKVHIYCLYAIAKVHLVLGVENISLGKTHEQPNWRGKITYFPHIGGSFITKSENRKQTEIYGYWQTYRANENLLYLIILRCFEWLAGRKSKVKKILYTNKNSHLVHFLWEPLKCVGKILE